MKNLLPNIYGSIRLPLSTCPHLHYGYGLRTKNVDLNITVDKNHKKGI